jgi:uncharacterized Zn-binding protein involved in type VI secretion
MARKIIVLGDPTDHGGKVISGSLTQTISGKPIARLGDQVTCPIKGHGVNAIVEGEPSYLINGIPVALEGHKTACGCSLIGTVAATHGGFSMAGAGPSVVNVAGISELISPVKSLKQTSFNGPVAGINNYESFGVSCALVIRLTRKWQTKESTVGEFFIETTDIKGYILEEKGPSTLQSGLEQRIPAGEYEIVWHQGRKFVKALRLRGSGVQDSRAILIHAGNTARDTEGCLLPGSGYVLNSVTGSQAMVKKIYAHAEAFGYLGGSFKDGAAIKGGAKIIINEEFKNGT